MKNKIGPAFPFVDFHPMHQAIRPEIDEAIQKVLDSEHYICGPEVAAFESEFAQYCGTKYCIGVSNGLDALILILRGLGISKGDEVILPANTFIATALAVTAVGAKPVLVDIDAETFNLDPKLVVDRINSRTKALIAVHLYGQLADMDALGAICKSAKIFLIEDAAQAHGATNGAKVAGAFGVAAGFSFYPGKNLGAFGDGGAVTTDDEHLAQRVRLLRGYGSIQKYVHKEKGVNARLDELQAAILRVKLKFLKSWTDERRKIASVYDHALRETGLVLPMLPLVPQSHVWHLYVARTKNRSLIQSNLREAGVETLIHYPIPIHLQEAYSDLGYNKGDFPITEQLAEEIISLPLWIGLSRTECAKTIVMALTNI
jgi:dTDP-4-amino-4,6-dideoxygalactose transaminase